MSRFLMALILAFALSVPARADTGAAAVDDAFVELDPNADRVGLFPSAHTLRQGKSVINSYMLFFLQYGYGLTDNLQFSLGTMVPIAPGELLPVQVGMKWRFLESGRVRVAALSSLAGVLVRGGGGGFFTAGALSSICIDSACESFFNLGVDANWIVGSTIGFISEGFAFRYTGGVVYKVGNSVKLVGELASGGLATMNDFALARGAVFTYGLRLFGSDIAGDIGFMKFFAEGLGMDFFPIGFPVVNFSYRFGG